MGLTRIVDVEYPNLSQRFFRPRNPEVESFGFTDEIFPAEDIARRKDTVLQVDQLSVLGDMKRAIHKCQRSFWDQILNALPGQQLADMEIDHVAAERDQFEGYIESAASGVRGLIPPYGFIRNPEVYTVQFDEPRLTRTALSPDDHFDSKAGMIVPPRIHPEPSKTFDISEQCQRAIIDATVLARQKIAEIVGPLINYDPKVLAEIWNFGLTKNGVMLQLVS